MSVDPAQRDAWVFQIELLRTALADLSGEILFEFAIPRMGTRIDVVLLLDTCVCILEFKVGATCYDRSAHNQVWDYALDLKNFHEASHDKSLVPILIATDAKRAPAFNLQWASDRVAAPVYSNAVDLRHTLDAIRGSVATGNRIQDGWAQAPYRPTPTIIEAARALFANHAVEAIARHDAGAANLRTTSRRIEDLVQEAKSGSKKIICFVTGVPGAGKTLVGLNVATMHRREDAADHAVYLSGNGPLVAVLREALTRDEQERLRREGKKRTKADVGKPVKAFIQNIHHFRDEGLRSAAPPADHVVVFDEAQRAWNFRKTVQFMLQKKQIPNFDRSESSFLISYLDRHPDWAVIVCLVGGGQEIHDGEAGISAWLDAVRVEFPAWELHISSRLQDAEYAAGIALEQTKLSSSVRLDDSLHLSVSMRSFRAEHLSSFVKAALDCDLKTAREIHGQISGHYPMAITRNLATAKAWVRERSRGTERYGLVASSKAMRLKPEAIDVRAAIDPVHWFLDGPEDVRSSWYLEDCATEFQVQGLELDWACVTWDADLRHVGNAWSHHDFRGSKWINIKSPDNQSFLKNAYRVLLTRARQGMIIFVPSGNPDDATRLPAYYDKTYSYLRSLGLQEI